MKQFLTYFVFLLLIFSCEEENKIKEEVEKIEINLEIERFDKLFSNAKAEDIPSLKKKFPYLFPKKYPDSLWIKKLNDTLQNELEKEVSETFKNFSSQEDDLQSLFKYIRYYFPEYKTPKVVTLINEVDYDNRIVLSDSLLLIGLDNYLGSDHKFYSGMSNYVSKGLDKKYITSDVVSTFSKSVNQYPLNRTFLSKIIYFGKELYLKDILIPEASDAQKLNYTEDEVKWSANNEEQIWRYFIEKELLYSTDSSLDRRFLDPAPFSKFGLELDNESPGRLGRYIGFQIVRQYMKKNSDIPLKKLLKLPAETIFKKSNYKPKR